MTTRSNSPLCSIFKKTLPVVLLALCTGYSGFAQLKVGDNPRVLDPSAVLELESFQQGFLPPRMTTLQRDSILLPAKGLLIYNTSSNQIEVNGGTPESPSWTSSSVWTARVSPTGDTLFLPNGGSIILPGISQVNYPTVPVVLTQAPSRLDLASVRASGEVQNDGGRPILERGFVWGNSPNPTLGAPGYTTTPVGAGAFQSTLTGLSTTTTYYIRAYARNAVGTAYGAIQSFTLSALQGNVTDIDGNVYKTVKIGPLTWMAENLKTTRFANGDPINQATSIGQWASYTIAGPTCAAYNYSAANELIFGRLYNFAAAEDTRNVCPTGWHVPSYNELTLLTSAPEIAWNSRHLRAVETLDNGGYWFPPNNATNQSGFSVLPSGSITLGGSSTGKNSSTNFWSNTREGWGSFMILIDNQPENTLQIHQLGRESGFSIRCVKDY